MERIVEYQGYGISRKVTAALFAASAVFTASACSAESGADPDSAPSVGQSFEAEPTPVKEPEFTPTATGTYEEFAAVMDNPPLSNLADTMTTTDKEGNNQSLTCDEIIAWDAGQGIALQDFDPATDYPVCNGDNVITDMRALSAFFSNIETFVNSDAFPKGTDADIKIGITTEVGRAIYDQYDGYRQGIEGYDQVQDHDEIIEIVAFSAEQAYKWKNGMHEGHELTKDEIRTIYMVARDQVYNIGQTPGELTSSAKAPNQAAANQGEGLMDQLLNEAKAVPNDPYKLMDIGDMELPCHAIVSAPECTEEAQGYFNVVLDTYEDVSEQTGVDPAHTALIMFYSGVVVESGLAEVWTHDDLIAMADQNVFTDIQPEEIETVGKALGASDRYPALFGTEQLTR